MDNIIYSAFLKLTPKDQQDLIFDFVTLFNKQHKLESGVVRQFNTDLNIHRMHLAVEIPKKSKNLLKNLKSKKQIGVAVANALWDSPTFREMLVKEMKAQ